VKTPDNKLGLLFGFLPVFNGTYPEFNSAWFANIGKTLCLTLLINIFSPHASKLLLPLIKVFKRWTDRGCQKKIWKSKSEGEVDYDVRTKMVIQDDLNMLYTGD